MEKRASVRPLQEAGPFSCRTATTREGCLDQPALPDTFIVDVGLELVKRCVCKDSDRWLCGMYISDLGTPGLPIDLGSSEVKC